MLKFVHNDEIDISISVSLMDCRLLDAVSLFEPIMTKSLTSVDLIGLIMTSQIVPTTSPDDCRNAKQAKHWRAIKELGKLLIKSLTKRRLYEWNRTWAFYEF